MDVLSKFQEIVELGIPKLNQLCVEFKKTIVAKEFAIASLSVFENNETIELDFGVDLEHAVRDGDCYFFPTDQLLIFIAEHGTSGKQREKLIRSIRTARKHAGPNVYRRFELNLDGKQHLFLTCKKQNCGNKLQTNMRAYSVERGIWGPEPIECPKCQSTHRYDQNDLTFGPNGHCWGRGPTSKDL